ncbi:hypothetical protein PoB_000092600 [Plakobranchus ocellatus]|uniref:ISXO2-like transposase domain-containing protein n=1 Tax=Plakobranchus ocellatus TaxID=259542 RepID=A0AAV3WWF2_9GAST|nr:hypothetical protein PoB_000092600 [Plakobranchus ocellatus]
MAGAARIIHITDAEINNEQQVIFTQLNQQIQDDREIGGFNDDGEQITVEIDESLFFHRKYRGAHRGGHWVFGGVERDTGKCFMVTVPNRTRATLEPVIERFILPNSHIVSDGWAAYENIALRGGVYRHAVIIHQRHLQDSQMLQRLPHPLAARWSAGIPYEVGLHKIAAECAVLKWALCDGPSLQHVASTLVTGAPQSQLLLHV